MNGTDLQPSTPTTKLRWYQFSLRSLLIAVTVFCVLMGVNTRRSSRVVVAHMAPGPYRIQWHEYGWPWVFRMEAFTWDVNREPDRVTDFDEFFRGALAGDIVVGVAIFVAAAFLSKWFFSAIERRCVGARSSRKRLFAQR
jgi:hypothetical protein